ncbi:stage III sporulation protein AF [Evansella halocellulosilytica]|uniref:stage III sporulation protein AF n=1 Tax=Evansella halocellulosilytica TaxID=2011013 RepID=UPI000BB6A557|nr:stage III sporulation protein AF [Evansella halocellulosilytica]
MSVVTAWVTNIIILILFATILELLLPNSKMQRYVKLVVGLMLLMVMLQPILSIFQTDPEEWLSEMAEWGTVDEENQMNEIESKKNEIEMVQDAYISEQAAVQLKRQVESKLIEQFEVVPVEVAMTLETSNTDEILEEYPDVHVLLQRVEEVQEDEEISVVTIDPVVIDQDDEELETTDHPQNDLDDAITSFLSSEWSIPVEKIHVQWKGGEE